MTFHDVLYNNNNKNKKNSESGNVKACSLHRTPDETEAMRSKTKIKKRQMWRKHTDIFKLYFLHQKKNYFYLKWQFYEN